MNMYNNECCCSCGIKSGLCIIDMIKEFIESTKLVITCGSIEGEIKDDKYPNFLLVETTQEKPNKYICIDDINYIEIIPKENSYLSILNILNMNYQIPLFLETPCEENCCCKFSAIRFMQDKYKQTEDEKKKFNIRFKGIKINDGEASYEVLEDIYVVYLDYDIVWLRNRENTRLYIASLCNICLLAD